jgi:hypothetical protein
MINAVIMNPNLTANMNDDFKRVVPLLLDYRHLTSQETKDKASERIVEFYFGPDEIGEETWDGLTDMISDRYFIHPAETAARLHAKHASVYPYVFTFPGGDSPALRAIFEIHGDFGKSPDSRSLF